MLHLFLYHQTITFSKLLCANLPGNKKTDPSIRKVQVWLN